MFESLDDPYKPWMERAICADSPEPDLWFPDTSQTGGSYKEVAAQVERAIAVCNGCPVRLKCLTMALENGEKEGVWGGRNFSPAKRPGPKSSTCSRGHEYTPENTRRNTKGARICRTCARIHANTSYARSKTRRENDAA